MKDPERLSTLFAILAIAAALVVKVGHAARRIAAIPIKKHGRPARSLFALGLDTLRRYFVRSTLQQIFLAILSLIGPKTHHNPLQRLNFVK